MGAFVISWGLAHFRVPFILRLVPTRGVEELLVLAAGDSFARLLRNLRGREPPILPFTVDSPQGPWLYHAALARGSTAYYRRGSLQETCGGNTTGSACGSKSVHNRWRG